MIWTQLTEAIEAGLRAAGWYEPSRVAGLELAIPRDPAHGDWTTNLALHLSKELRKPPRAIAETLAAAIPRDSALFSGIEIAGPGFINFRYAADFLDGLPAAIVREGETFGRSRLGQPSTIQVEFVSANPTGPLNVVSARAAAVGDCLVRLLAAAGHESAGEFYVNDSGNQVELLVESVRARYAEQHQVPWPFPENGYVGEYVGRLAERLAEQHGDLSGDAADPERGRAAIVRAIAAEPVLATMIGQQERDLGDYGVTFDKWVRESTLHASGAVMATLADLERRGVVYEADGAKWLRTTEFGDDKDRVIVRGNGVPTYLLPDIAYHRDKRQRGFRYVIDLWGPDHHGHILPLTASLTALGLEPDFLQVLIVQQVNLLSAGQPVKMSKRAGEFITLRDLMEDVGADCAKFFFLMRSTNAHLDFDLDLAKRQNDENPAYYVQYAHARICSILRYAAERGLDPAAGASAALEAEEEVALVRKLATFPEVVRGAAQMREPHRLPAYLTETAAAFHRFYHHCRVVSEDESRSRQRLLVVEAVRTVLRNGLALMGVSAPERMERSAEVVA